MSCPSSTENGCRCPDHHPGLLAYSPNPPALEHALAKLRPVLRVVTMPGELDDPCDGTYQCACQRCVKQRAALMSAPRRREVRQPWMPRKAA